MKQLLKPILTVSALCLFSSPVLANELRGEQLVSLLNGNSFECSTSQGRFSWKFAKSDPAGKVFPFTVKFSGQTVKGAYTLDKKGRAKHQQANTRRKIVRNSNGTFSVTGNGIPKAICNPA